MKRTSFAFIISSFLALAGCGPQGTGTSDSGGSTSNGTSISGTVAVPTTTTTSTSLSVKSVDTSKSSAGSSANSSDSSFSVSKGASENAAPSSPSSAKDSSEEAPQVIVSKATTDTSNVSGTAVVELLDGTVLDRCTIRQGNLEGCDFDPTRLDATHQIMIVATINGTTLTSIVDASGASGGSTLSAGTTNSDTTVATTLTYQACDSNATPTNITAACLSALSAGTISPNQVYRMQRDILGIGATPSASNSQGAAAAMAECIRAAMATRTMTPADIAQTLQGGGVLSTCGSLSSNLSGVDLSGAQSVMANLPSASRNFFQDSTTRGNWCNDETSCQALAKSMGGYNSTALSSMASNPATSRNLYNQYASGVQSGNQSVINRLSQGSATFGNFIAQARSATMTSSQIAAARALFDNFTFTGVNQAQLGEAMFNNVFSCSGDCSTIRNNPAALAGAMFNHPEAYIGAAGLAAAGQLVGSGGYFATGGSTSNITSCVTSSDCPSSRPLCGIQRVCIASGGFGATCSTNSDCSSSTGYCNLSDLRCEPPAGGSGCFQVGSGCTTNADCCGSGLGNISCSSRVCTYSSGGGGSSLLANGAVCSGNAVNSSCTSNYCGGPSGARVCTASAGGLFGHVCSGAGQCGTGLTCSSGFCGIICGDGLVPAGETFAMCPADRGPGVYKVTALSGTCKKSNNVNFAINDSCTLKVSGNDLSTDMAAGDNCAIMFQNILTLGINGFTCAINPGGSLSTFTGRSVSADAITCTNAGTCTSITWTHQ